MTTIELAPTAAVDCPPPAPALYASPGGVRQSGRSWTIPIGTAAGRGVAGGGNCATDPIVPIAPIVPIVPIELSEPMPTVRLGGAAPAAAEGAPSGPCPALATNAFVAPHLRLADAIRVYDEDDWFYEGRVSALTATNVRVDFRRWWAIWQLDALRWEVVECGREAWVAPGYSAMLGHGEIDAAEPACTTVGVVF